MKPVLFFILTATPFLVSSQEVPFKKIISDSEAGKLLALHITVLDLDTKKPVNQAEVFVYQTNHKGDYERDKNNTARISGTLKTNHEGRLRFLTIYPRGYNDSPTGEHMHFRVNATGYRNAVADLIFADYYRKRYDFENPFTYKVYLQSLKEQNGQFTGEALIFLKKI